MTKVQTEIDALLKTVKSIHMIGIGGSGMCPLAEILHSWGYSLTGSDNNETDTLARIRKMGIPVTLGHSPDNIADAEMVVYSAAIMRDNPELSEAFRRSVPTFERSVLLGAVSRRYENSICISGTHGKTTVTSMLAQIMIEAAADPAVVIGGKLPLIDANGRAGNSDTLICEACEFNDTFLELSPAVSVLLNIDDDHLEYFKTMDNLVNSFSIFASNAKKAVICNGDDPLVMKSVSGLSNIITFGLSDSNDYYAENIRVLPGVKCEFELMYKKELLGTLRLNVPGRHNVLNALAASAAAFYAGMNFRQIESGLAHFTGAGRRFEILGRPDGITVADDYAHHPTELRAVLSAAMEMGFNKVWAVFQPFTFSRTVMLMDDFVTALKIPDRVVLSEIMGSREINTYGVHASDLGKKIDRAVWFETFNEIADYIFSNAKTGDLVITLGCGDIYKAAKLILEKY